MRGWVLAGFHLRVRGWVRDRGGFRVRGRVRGYVRFREGFRVRVGLGGRLEFWTCEKNKCATTVRSSPLWPCYFYGIFTAFLRPKMILHDDEFTGVLADLNSHAISSFFVQFKIFWAVSWADLCLKLPKIPF